LEKTYLAIELCNLEENGHTITDIETVEHLFEYKQSLQKVAAIAPKTQTYPPRHNPSDQRGKTESNQPQSNPNKNPPKNVMESDVEDIKPQI